ncbi:MAG TPA: NfeD family protein [Solirubrobacteraceae bacterium]|jgi:membrane protein implicated in regulation of membrane protease activity|nr:NfeD family protein [Solirubrobacteraceae bacterium]
MAGWIVWLVVACGFGAGEVLSGSSFYLAPFAVGAALAAAAAGAFDETAAWVVFIVASIGTLMTVRPLVQSRLMRGTPTLRTGGAALVGKRAVVLERIANHEGVGRVRIESEVWTARSLDDESVIEPGTSVEVIDIKGATALVME